MFCVGADTKTEAISGLKWIFFLLQQGQLPSIVIFIDSISPKEVKPLITILFPSRQTDFINSPFLFLFSYSKKILLTQNLLSLHIMCFPHLI